MERGETRPPEKRRRRRCIILSVVAVLLLIIIVAVVLGLTVGRNTRTLKTTFTERCEEFKGYDCEKLWGVFERAYVGLDPCEVPMEAYDPLMAAVPFKPECNRKIFWSKTKDVVHDFTEKRDCFYTVEETLLGSVLNGLTWCGKEGSSETFTTGCPGWTDCANNTVRSFWNRVSAAFADGACGDVTVMLNGSIATPFHPARTNCTNASLKDLQKELDQGMTYDCKEVSEAQIQECSSNPEKPCGACW